MLGIVGIAALCITIWASGTSGAFNSLDGPSVQAIENPLRVLREPGLAQRDPDRVMKAIRRLGELRAVEAVPDLINLLGFRYRYRWEREGGPRVMRPTSLSRYPAREALIEIGKPALPALVEVVEAHEFSSIESKNARYTIRVIFRDEPLKADEFFKQAAAKAPSPKASDRLLRAVQTAEEDMKLAKEDM